MEKKKLWYLILLVSSYLPLISHKYFVKLCALVCIIIFINHNFAMEKLEKTGDDFSWEDHEYFMELIKQVDSDAYEKLRQCEQELSKPCIRHLHNDPNRLKINFTHEQTHGYPIILIDPKIEKYDVRVQKELLTIILKTYNKLYAKEIEPVTVEERIALMDIIRSIAPLLYEEITKADPTGLDHIKRRYKKEASFAVSLALKDGLPRILIGPHAMEMPLNEQRFAVAHELGHYALEHLHFNRPPIIVHAILNKGKQDSTIEFQKGKNVSGQLPFIPAFKNAWSRTQEDEADRFAILDIGMDIADGIAFAERRLKNESFDPKETFQSTHPNWRARIRHLQELQREVELRKSKGTPLKQINWKKLANDYLEN